MAMLFFILFGAEEEKDAVIAQFLKEHTDFSREQVFATIALSGQEALNGITAPIDFRLSELKIDGIVSTDPNPKNFDIPLSFTQLIEGMRTKIRCGTARQPTHNSECLEQLRHINVILSLTLAKEMDDGRQIDATYEIFPSQSISSQPKFIIWARNDELKEIEVFAALTVFPAENIQPFWDCLCFTQRDTLQNPTTIELDGYVQFKDGRLYKKVAAHYFENERVKKWIGDLRDRDVGVRRFSTWYDPQDSFDALVSCLYGSHLNDGVYKLSEEIPFDNFAGLYSYGNGQFSIAKKKIKILQKIDTERMFLTHSMPDSTSDQRTSKRPLFERINEATDFSQTEYEYNVSIVEKISAIDCKFDDGVNINATSSLNHSGYPHEGFYTYDIDQYVLTKIDEPSIGYTLSRHDGRMPGYDLPMPQNDEENDQNKTPEAKKQAYRDYLDLVSHTAFEALFQKIDLGTISTDASVSLRQALKRMRNLTSLSVKIDENDITDFVCNVLRDANLINLKTLRLDSENGASSKNYANAWQDLENIGSTLANLHITQLTIRRPWVWHRWTMTDTRAHITSTGIDTGKSIGASIGTVVGLGIGGNIGSIAGLEIGLNIGSGIGAGIGTCVGIGIGSCVGIGIGASIGIGYIVQHPIRLACGISFREYEVFAREIGRSQTLLEVTFLGLKHKHDETNMRKAFNEGANGRKVTVNFA